MNEKLKELLLLIFWLVIIYIGVVLSTAITSLITRFVLEQVNLFEELSGYLPRLLSIVVTIASVSIYYRKILNENFIIHALGNQGLIFKDFLVGIFGTSIVLAGAFFLYCDLEI